MQTKHKGVPSVEELAQAAKVLVLTNQELAVQWQQQIALVNDPSFKTAAGEALADVKLGSVGGGPGSRTWWTGRRPRGRGSRGYPSKKRRHPAVHVYGVNGWCGSPGGHPGGHYDFSRRFYEPELRRPKLLAGHQPGQPFGSSVIVWATKKPPLAFIERWLCEFGRNVSALSGRLLPAQTFNR